MTDRYASLKQGLVGCWIPSVSGSGNTLPDVSGYGNHGTLTNMSPDDWVSGQYGRALDFDGVNDFLDYGRCDQLSGLGVLSCSFWCYPKSANEMYGLIRYNTTIAIGSERRADYFGIQATGGVLYPMCYFSVAGNPFFFQSFTSTSLPVAQNTWSHVAFSVNLAGNTATIAVNGVSIAGTRTSGGTPPTATAAQGTVTWRSQTYIVSGGTQFYFDGQIDDVRQYNRALTEPEIKLLASRPGIGLQPSPTRLIAREKKTGLRRKILTGQT